MTDSELVWKFLSREYTDNHPNLYLYIHGNVRTPQTAINNALEIAKSIFHPFIKESIILTTIKAFLEYKKKQYNRGEITFNPLY